MPPTVISPRSNTTEQINTIKKRIFFGNQGQQMIGSMPVGSFISKVEASVETVFNAGTTNPLAVGVTPGGGELLTAGDINLGATGYGTNARGLGTGLTQSAGAANAVGDPEGGVGVYVSYAPTGTAPTTGSVTVLITFMPPVE